MFGLIYLGMFLATLAVGVHGAWAFARQYGKRPDFTFKSMLFVFSAIGLSLLAYTLAASFLAGHKFYAFDVVYYVVGISTGILLTLSLLFHLLGERWALLSQAARLGTAFLVPYIFIILESLENWLNIQSYY